MKIKGLVYEFFIETKVDLDGTIILVYWINEIYIEKRWFLLNEWFKTNDISSWMIWWKKNDSLNEKISFRFYLFKLTS